MLICVVLLLCFNRERDMKISENVIDVACDLEFESVCKREEGDELRVTESESKRERKRESSVAYLLNIRCIIGLLTVFYVSTCITTLLYS